MESLKRSCKALASLQELGIERLIGEEERNLGNSLQGDSLYVQGLRGGQPTLGQPSLEDSLRGESHLPCAPALTF